MISNAFTSVNYACESWLVHTEIILTEWRYFKPFFIQLNKYVAV